ncbi:MAG: hypothetical protein R2844_03200 [Caldilineales bacterium]
MFVRNALAAMKIVAMLAGLLSAGACVSAPPTPALPVPPSSTQPAAAAPVSPPARVTPAGPADSPSPVAAAANADVEHVRAVRSGDGSWTFHVTVRHPDTGWEDYADGWDVVLPDGSVVKPDPDSLFTRLLLHPHETEQPFTRSQSGIVIPPGVTTVTVRAHDLVDGWGGRAVAVDLAAASGPNFEVVQ